MSLAERTELLDFQATRRVLFVLLRGIVAALAIHARQQNINAHDSSLLQAIR
jgi:hypothetical protein